jgi:hypothetical protein
VSARKCLRLPGARPAKRILPNGQILCPVAPNHGPESRPTLW